MDFDVLGIILGVHHQDFTQKLELFIVAWFIIKHTINKHFARVEGCMNSLVTELQGVRKTLTDVATGLDNHSQRILGLEKRMDNVETKGGSSVST